MTDIDIVLVTPVPQTLAINTTPNEVLTFATPGPQGAQGPAGAGGGVIVFNQSTPASTWTISHTLNRIPMVQVYDSSGDEVIADVVSTNINITVTFASPQTGTVVYA